MNTLDYIGLGIVILMVRYLIKKLIEKLQAEFYNIDK